MLSLISLHLVETWGVTGEFYTLNKVVGYPQCQGPSMALLFLGGTYSVSPGAIQWCFISRAKARLCCPSQNFVAGLPNLATAMAMFAWLWGKNTLQVHHRESLTFWAVLKSLFCYNSKQIHVKVCLLFWVAF